MGSILFASCGSEQNSRTRHLSPACGKCSSHIQPPVRTDSGHGADCQRTGLNRPRSHPRSLRSRLLPRIRKRPASAGSPDTIVGTIVRFAGPNTTVDVTIVEDNATARSFLSRLPLTVEFEDFNGREKISYPPGGLDVVESGHDSENGDFIYYVPWGNVGFYYNAAGIQFDNDVVLIGRYDATPEQLIGIEGGVSISIVSD